MNKNKLFDRCNMDSDRPIRKILETDKCDWCEEKKAIITDGTYVYCSKDCKNLFIDDAHEAMKQASERNFNKE